MTTSSTFIPEIFEYCDRWCARCPFQRSCILGDQLQSFEAIVADGRRFVDVWLLDRDEDPSCSGMFPSWVSPLDREAFLSILRRDDPTLSAEEYKQKEAALDQRSSRVLQHPLSRAGAAYGWAVRDEIQQLYDQLYPLGELEADQALEAIARHAGRIGSLAARAAAGLIDGLSGEPDEELRGVQSDANGAAKLLRLLLGESRHSWNLLAGDEHVVELEGQMLWHLYRIDDLVKEHFPRAMEFVRPGFDDPAGRPCDPCISPLD